MATVGGLGIAGLLAVALPAYGHGGAGTTGSSTSGQSSHPRKQLSGTVQKYDKDSNELTLANSDKKLKLTDSTKVMRNGRRASTTDIREGDQVRASYSGSGDTLNVTRIDLIPSEATPGSSATGKPSSGGGSK
jgi:Cu/Ag efflux protein CusF